MSLFRIVSVSVLALTTSCASVEDQTSHCGSGAIEVSEILWAGDGKWYGFRRLSDTDYETKDCRFDRSGAFACLNFENGCFGRACDGHSYSIEGSWKVEGGFMIWKKTSGFGPDSEKREFVCVTDRLVSFADGSLLFKKRWRRDAEI